MFHLTEAVMSEYRRALVPGGMWFFTVNLSDRTSDLLVREIGLLRASAREVRRRYPCRVIAAVVLPDHLHAILQLPAGDADFPGRWRFLKTLFVRALPRSEYIPGNRARRGERGIWQRRYWEHMIRDEDDLRAHVDYVHVNPVKHGLVSRVRDWPHSSFSAYVRAGVLPVDWGGDQRDLPGAAWDRDRAGVFP
jgi:putative transposase